MAKLDKDRKEKKRKKEKDTDEIEVEKTRKKSLKESTLKSVWGIVLFVLAAFFAIAPWSGSGSISIATYASLDGFFGYGYYLIPTILLLLSLSFFSDQERAFPLSKVLGTILFVFSGLGLFGLVSVTSGGIVGNAVATLFMRLFGTGISFIFLTAFVIISVLVIYDEALRKEHLMPWRFIWKKNAAEDEADNEQALDREEEAKMDAIDKSLQNKALSKGQPVSDIKDGIGIEERPASVLEAIKKKVTGVESASASKEASKETSDDLIQVSRKSILLGKPFVPPPLSLLEGDSGKPGVGDIKANANVIKRTLQNFGVDVEMDEVAIGPSVTRYALKPAEGVKLSKILGLQNNLSLALAAHPIRIEAPIPGKSLVGIEIPNSVKTKVGLGPLLAQDDYQKSDLPLLVALGKGISGKSYYGNIAKMPHLLIAGTTGSGKSVTIHSIIVSLLFRNSPENLRLIMIDPKRVELTQYNKIPHLLTPVITDAKKAILALKWAAKEMDRRYNVLEKHGVRDIGSYHKNVLMPALEKRKANPNKEDAESAATDNLDPMSYIVIVIDELADIMQTYPRELEAGIVRLAQMSRAVGIHLILSTQRPSVNVITGLIKANVPARLALQVASQIDSRTILDMRGAEELLGAGDMLYLSGDMATPQRVQSAFITEAEIKKIVKHLVDTMDALPTEITLNGEAIVSGNPDPVFSSSLSEDEDVDDDLYEEAKQTVIEAGKASTSYIQRKLRVGYARAARLMDILEQKGVIGPADGAKPREVLTGNQGQSGEGETGGSEGRAEEEQEMF